MKCTETNEFLSVKNTTNPILSNQLATSDNIFVTLCI